MKKLNRGPMNAVGYERRSNEVQEVIRLRNLAIWYREFADKAAVPWIWEARLRHAEELDREADLIAARGSARSGIGIDGACDSFRRRLV